MSMIMLKQIPEATREQDQLFASESCSCRYLAMPQYTRYFRWLRGQVLPNAKLESTGRSLLQ
jgi:hypothetical protein